MFITRCHRVRLQTLAGTKDQSLETGDTDNSKIAAWGIYKWDNFISPSVLEVPFVWQLYEMQVIDQVGNIP